MKVCFITNNIATRGGQERVLSEVANHLADRNNDIDVSILFTSNKEISTKFAYELSENVNTIWDKEVSKEKQRLTCAKLFRFLSQKTGLAFSPKIMSKLFFSKYGVQALNRVLSEQKFDVVIGLTPYWSAILPLLKIDARKIGWMHSSYSRYFHTKNEAAWNQDRLYNYLLSQLDELVVLTDASKTEFSRYIALQPTRIYNPITIGEGKEVSRAKNKLLYVGRIDYNIKGLDYLLSIVTKLKNLGYTLNLTIVGFGKDFDKLQKEIAKRELNNIVKMVGNKENVEDFYKESSVLLLTSRKEGFGLVAVEAMYNQLPVISFETEGPSEIITNGENGYLIECFNVQKFTQKVAHLLDNPKEQIIIGQKGKERAEDFSTKSIISQWEDLIKKTVKIKKYKE